LLVSNFVKTLLYGVFWHNASPGKRALVQVFSLFHQLGSMQNMNHPPFFDEKSVKTLSETMHEAMDGTMDGTMDGQLG
jgi:hypothetical protein